MKRDMISPQPSGASFIGQRRIGAPPVHFDPKVAEWLTSHAESKGRTLNDLVNEPLKKDIELIETAK